MTTQDQCIRSVSIAQDVLKQLSVMRVSTSSFIYPRNDTEFTTAMAHLDNNLTPATNLARRKCEVCAIGACFLSLLDMSAKPYTITPLECKWGVDIDGIEPLLAEWMGARNVALIEAAFEIGSGYYDYIDAERMGFGEDELDDAKNFGRAYETAPERLKAIMENVITNRGEFQPGERTLDRL